MIEVDDETYKKMTELYFTVKGLSAPSSYEEDGFYCSCGYCHGDLYKNKHKEYCSYKRLQDIASSLDDEFKI